MYIKYGSYQHETNECTIAISKRHVYSENFKRYAYRDRWEITGRLQAADQTALTSAINAMATAYGTNGYDLELYTNAGALTSHHIDSSATASGTMVTEGPDFPEGTGAEYTTFRNYRIVVEAETAAAASSLLISDEQTLTYRGAGGPIWRYLPVLTGSPQKQMLYQRSTKWLYQRGRRERIGSYASVPAPLKPSDEHQEMRETNWQTLRDGSNRKILTYSYTMEYL